jgi:hypothetical protein
VIHYLSDVILSEVEGSLQSIPQASLADYKAKARTQAAIQRSV